jgi:hypothetical protein
MLPNLLCVGVEKSGTTFLNKVFEKSPAILTPEKKELFFFNQHFEEGLGWYQNWFKPASKPDASYVCDITPSYFRNPRTILRIKETLPNARILVLVRHPVYRSFSHYVHRLRHIALKLESYDLSLWEILEGKRENKLIFPRYYEHFRFLLEHFSPEDILVLSYEIDLFDPLQGERKLKEFLALDDLDFSSLLGTKVNDGCMPRFYYGGEHGAEFGGANGEVYYIPAHTLVLSHAKGDNVWKSIPRELAEANVQASRSWTSGLSRPEVRNIMEQHFARDNELLSKHFNIDISPWAEDAAVSYDDALPGQAFRIK